MSAPILVVGTDIELLAISVAERIRAPVVALVSEPSLIDRVSPRARLHGVQDLIDFQLGSVHKLPFARDAFSAVVAKSLRPAPGTQLELDELVRVLAPAGRFVAIEDIDEWSTSGAIGFAMDFWHQQLDRYKLDQFQIHVARFADIHTALEAARG